MVGYMVEFGTLKGLWFEACNKLGLYISLSAKILVQILHPGMSKARYGNSRNFQSTWKGMHTPTRAKGTLKYIGAFLQ